MAGLGTVVILLTLGVSDEARDATPPTEVVAPVTPPTEVVAPAKAPATSNPPVPPIQYLRAAIMFFNKGKYEEAGKYLEATQRFRDQLKEKERIVLDVYRDELAAYHEERRRAETEAARAPETDPGIVQANRVTVEPSKNENAKAMPRNAKPVEPVPALLSRQRAGGGDIKDEGRWLIHEAREQIRLGNFEEAERKLAQVRSMKLTWGKLEDNPDKLARDIEYFRKQKPPGRKPAAHATHDLPTARTMLSEARTALTRNDVASAEAIAREIQSWKLDTSKLEDNPDKVLATIRSIRLTETIRKYGGELPAQAPPR